MLDGPTVLGWDTWHALDERYGFGAIKGVLAQVAKAGALPPASVVPMAHLLLGAVMQAGMVVARADDPASAKRAMVRTFGLIVASL